MFIPLTAKSNQRLLKKKVF